MQYLEFTQSYPFLNTQLIDWASQRIAKTANYLESEARAYINVLESKIEHRRLEMPLGKQVFAEFPDGIIMEDFERLAMQTDEEYRYLHTLLLEAKSSLAEIRATTITPTFQEIRQATEEVRDYVQALQNPSVDIFLSWNCRLSSREKFYVQLLPSFLGNNDEEVSIIGKLAKQEWGYLDWGYQALTEPVVQSFYEQERLIWAITKNSYGVNCLNALTVMFVDIDLNKDEEDCAFSAFPWGNSRFQESEVMEAISQTTKNWELRFAVYRTRNGLRLIEMSREWNPNSHESQTVLEALGCDRLFQSLCISQGSYRARLEAKPWRVKPEQKHCVCQYLKTFGTAPENSTAKQIKTIHDNWCLTDGTLA